MAKTSSFKKIDVTRALSAIQASGVKIGRIDVDLQLGKMSIVPDNAATDSDDALDKWMNKRAR
ncbi:MAG: hypothetical protein ACK4M8_02730 [Allorhizobium sp.]